jgi:hypothetical protein
MASNFNSDAYDPTYIPQRTSVMAIIALVLSLVCFVPGFGVLAVILGIAAIIAISSARGRLIGTGLAATAIVLGLLFSVIQIGIGIGVYQAYQAINSKVIGPANQAIAQFDSAGDVNVLRNLFSPTVNARYSDAQISAFRDAYRAEVGAFKSVPTSISQAFGAYKQFGQQMSKYQGTPGKPNDLIPVPAQFEKGWALVVFQIDASRANNKVPVAPGASVSTTSAPANGLPLLDVAIESLSGKTIRLSEMPGGPAPTDPAKPPELAKPADAPKPAEVEKPKDPPAGGN